MHGGCLHKVLDKNVDKDIAKEQDLHDFTVRDDNICNK